MASTSPKATRTAVQTPVRGRGRGRPRLYARGTSSAARRKIQQASAQKAAESPSVSRRRPANNGYRPGGAGGGGRYIHPSTGEEIPASVYKEIVKSGGGGGGYGGLGASARRSAPHPPATPAPPPAVGPDGVYKPREERSYTEFHPGFDVDQPLHAFTAQEVDGETYKPPLLPEPRTVKISDVKEEDELRKDSSCLSATRDGSQSATSVRGSAQPEAAPPPPHADDFAPRQPKHRPESESAASPVSPSSNGPNGVSAVLRTDRGPVSATANGIGGEPAAFAISPGAAAGSASHGLAIAPALALAPAALTPPPLPPSESVPIDPALALKPQPPPAQTQTPAATPTDAPLSDEPVALPPTPPPPPPPATPAAAGTESATPLLKRGASDVPTLASLRAHRTTAGKPPPRALPPLTARKPRPPTRDHNNQEKLNLRAPSYRKIQPFRFSDAGWSAAVGGRGACALNSPQPPAQAKPMSDTMFAVGYQRSACFHCPDTLLRDRLDIGIDEELGSDHVDLVEYDMDEQDDKWLTNYNSQRMIAGDESVSREVFEFVMTRTEKEWVGLERKMPKVQAKPHGAGLPNRRRSSGRAAAAAAATTTAAAADDDDDEGAEDSKCAICDDGECENANAIVFCDGCNLAVHQECYGVPYIPEGQWHCRKCQQIPRQTAICVFCPNTDGAFKQTTTNRWAHLLCAIWIPEVRLANPSFMEPVEGVDLVPKSRWKLNCYICKQRMGACIQCSNRNCFLAFHVTCGRRARLHMKMKNTNVPGAQLESSGLKALCHKHVPAEWRKENDVEAATADAMEFYATAFSGREWGDSHAASTVRTGLSDDDLAHSVAARGNRRAGEKRKAAAVEQKTVWKLPSGAPVIPNVLHNVIAASLERFGISDARSFASEACKYWTLKREARRGASLVRRLQVQADSNSFTSLEVIRKNYASMGRVQGTKKLERRKDFAGALEKDLEQLIGIVRAVRTREDGSVKEAEVRERYVDALYFPELPLMRDVLAQAQNLDCHNVFQRGFALVRDRLKHRLYPTVSAFSTDLQSVLQSPPDSPQTGFDIQVKNYVPPAMPLSEAPAGRHDAGSIGRKIMHSLRGVLESAATREKSMHVVMQGPPAKRPRLLDEIALGGVCRNTDGGNDIRNSPSVQLVREVSPEASSTSAPSCGGGGGRTVLATVSRKLVKGMLAVSDDKERPPWFVEDYRPREAAEAGSGPLIVGNAAPSNRQSCSPSPSPAASRLTPGPGESANECVPTTTPSITSTSTSATSTTTSSSTTTTTTSTASTTSTALEEAHVAEADAMDEDMEDAPGEVDDEFLPAASAGHSLESHPGPEAERLPTLHSDLHDEDAEGDLDDDLDGSYPSAPPATAAVNPVPVRVTLPDLDSAHEDDLLSGFRSKDLPSPLGIVTGDSSSPAGTATHKTQLLDVQDFAHPASLANRDPAVDLPDPPPNQATTAEGGGGMDLENLTNTSVLSDCPDDLDENWGFDMDIVPDADEVCRETTTPPSKRGRGAVGHKREPNGRFGSGGSRRRRRS